MLASTPEDALHGASVAVVGTADPDTVRALVDARPDHVLDVHGRLGAAVEALPGYEGIAW
jgi:GDP-mannose 6-dehydrogenase